MLRQIKLTHFRRHVDKVITFAEGVNVIRAVNEAGKSTIIEAALYALFGSKALRDSLSDTVTWGMKENALKVELTVEIAGHLYNFNRSKNGAEAQHEGGIVTGQNEVSAFATTLLGADANAANKLMLANQNNLRGALLDGPKAIAEQIETLADFDLFDRLIDAATSKLPLGSTSYLDQRVVELKTTLETLDVHKPDLADFDTKETELKEVIARASEHLEFHQASAIKFSADFQSAQNQKRMYDGIVTSLEKAKEQLALHEQQFIKAQETSFEVVDTSKLAQLNKQLQDVEYQAKLAVLYEELTRLMKTFPEVFWEGDKDSYLTELANTEKTLDTLKNQESEEKSALQNALQQQNSLKSKVIHSLDCPTCHRPLENHSEVAEKNLQLETEVKALESTIHQHNSNLTSIKAQIADTQGDLDTLRSLMRVATPYENFKGDFVSYDFNSYPPKLLWSGPVEFETINMTEVKREIQIIEDQQAAILKAKAQIESLADILVDDRAYIERVAGQLAECPEPDDVESIKSKMNEALNAKAVVQLDIDRYRKMQEDNTRERMQAESDYEARLEQRKNAEAQLEQAKQDAEDIVFNNALVKKIRTARPLVADKLWGIVLNAVSTMFSTMRGEPSVVTKDSSGFKVNESPVSSLSGSTLDLLGLAIRVALVKTFLPNTSLLVLDEPAAACDDNRESQMLGFLAASGFKQTLLITHSDQSEGIANHLITL